MRNVKVVFGIEENQLAQRAKYVLSQISHVVGVKFDIAETEMELGGGVVLHYGPGKRDSNYHHQKFVIIPNFKWIEGREDRKGQEIPAISACILFDGERIPIWYHFYTLDNVEPLATYESGGCAVGVKHGHVYFGFDLIMCAFHLLTCQEEYLIPKRDKFGRFLGAYSPRAKDNLLELPTVNYYAMLLWQAIEGNLEENDRPSRYPQFYASLSHDVDNVSSKGIWILAAYAYRLFRSICRFDVKLFFPQLKHLMRKVFSSDNLRLNFEVYVDIEKNHNAKSSFYFITGKRGRYGARYDLNKLRDVIHYLQKSRWGVGLHTNFYSFDKWKEIKKEREALENIFGDKIFGSRNHYLRFGVPHSWSQLVKAGIKYDSSLGYPDASGFRAGIAYPFFPYDLERDEILPVIEIPLAVMDSTLIEVMSLTKENTLDGVKKLIDHVAKVNGVITILWHSQAPYDMDFPLSIKVYEKILSFIEMKGGKFITEDEALKLIPKPIQ